MAALDWNRFLKEWSGELAEFSADLPPADDVPAGGWLGFSGASEEQVAAAECRLGAALPPSYRAFLKASNGWRHTGASIYRVWSTEEVDWFSARNQDWIDAYAQADLDPIPDADYLNYDEDQDPCLIRPDR